MHNAKNAPRHLTRQFLPGSHLSLVDILPGDAAKPAVSSVIYIPVTTGERWEGIAAELRAAGFEIRPAPMPEIRKAPALPLILCSREV
jgi:hypothetical protein